MKLINNEAVDLIFAMYRFANRNKQPENNYQGIPELSLWCDEYEKKLSPFLLNDISLMIEKMILPTVYLFILFKRTPGIETGEDFLNTLEKITPDEFLDYLKTELIGEKEKELTIELLNDVLVNDGLHPGYDHAEEAELLYGFLKDPENFLNRLHKTYSDFYRLVYKPGRSSLIKLASDKLRWHQRRLALGVEEYLEQLGLHSFISSLSENEEPTLFFSLFLDNDISSFWSTKTVVIGAGTDQRIINRSARDKADIFFSCFGDSKRLEILRLTSQRPWYSTELANHFEVKPATLSYHINILVDAELLHIVKGESRRFYYTLNKKSIEEYLGFVAKDLLGLNYNIEASE
ncbi:MAG: helix-turn-helix transcriptional regulator [Spirochaetales bacterium]|nr:helix-turn-helix transcriptional regulator [Spirochaetales bacterium]